MITFDQIMAFSSKKANTKIDEDSIKAKNSDCAINTENEGDGGRGDLLTTLESGSLKVPSLTGDVKMHSGRGGFNSTSGCGGFDSTSERGGFSSSSKRAGFKVPVRQDVACVPKGGFVTPWAGSNETKRSTSQDKIGSVKIAAGRGSSKNSALRGVNETSAGRGAGKKSAPRGAGKNSGGRGASKTSGGRGASKTSGGRGASKTSGGRGASKTSGGRGASKSSGGRGASKSTGGRGASKSTGGRGSSNVNKTSTSRDVKSSAGRGVAKSSGGQSPSDNLALGSNRILDQVYDDYIEPTKDETFSFALTPLSKQFLKAMSLQDLVNCLKVRCLNNEEAEWILECSLDQDLDAATLLDSGLYAATRKLKDRKIWRINFLLDSLENRARGKRQRKLSAERELKKGQTKNAIVPMEIEASQGGSEQEEYIENFHDTKSMTDRDIDWDANNIMCDTVEDATILNESATFRDSQAEPVLKNMTCFSEAQIVEPMYLSTLQDMMNASSPVIQEKAVKVQLPLSDESATFRDSQAEPVLKNMTCFSDAEIVEPVYLSTLQDMMDASSPVIQEKAVKVQLPLSDNVFEDGHGDSFVWRVPEFLDYLPVNQTVIESEREIQMDRFEMKSKEVIEMDHFEMQSTEEIHLGQSEIDLKNDILMHQSVIQANEKIQRGQLVVEAEEDIEMSEIEIQLGGMCESHPVKETEDKDDSDNADEPPPSRSPSPARRKSRMIPRGGAKNRGTGTGKITSKRKIAKVQKIIPSNIQKGQNSNQTSSSYKQVIKELKNAKSKRKSKETGKSKELTGQNEKQLVQSNVQKGNQQVIQKSQYSKQTISSYRPVINEDTSTKMKRAIKEADEEKRVRMEAGRSKILGTVQKGIQQEIQENLHKRHYSKQTNSSYQKIINEDTSTKMKRAIKEADEEKRTRMEGGRSKILGTELVQNEKPFEQSNVVKGNQQVIQANLSYQPDQNEAQLIEENLDNFTEKVTSENIVEMNEVNNIETSNELPASNVDETSSQVKFTCQMCGASFLYLKKYKSHIAKNDCGLKPKCSQCNMQFLSTKTLKQHVKNKHIKPLYMCSSCDIIFPSEKKMLNHITFHHEEKTCPYCDKLFKNANTVKSHRNKCSSRETNKNNVAAKKKQQPQKIKSCNICDKTFSGTSGLSKHMQTHKDASNPEGCTEFIQATSDAVLFQESSDIIFQGSLVLNHEETVQPFVVSAIGVSEIEVATTD